MSTTPDDDQEAQAQPIEPYRGVRDVGKRMEGGLLARYPEIRALFLKRVARYGSEPAAAASLRITMDQVNRFSETYPEFAEQIEIARGQFLGKLEREAVSRAIHGVEEDVFQQGRVVGTRVRKSDRLLLALLRKADPSGYGAGDVAAKGNEPDRTAGKTENAILAVVQYSADLRSALCTLLHGAKDVPQLSQDEPKSIPAREIRIVEPGSGVE